MCLMKISLYIFNLIFMILGLLLIVCGVLIYTFENHFDILLKDTLLPFLSVGVIAISLGVVIFIATFIGFCGAIKENTCLLTLFIVLLIIIIVVQIVVVILGYFYQAKVDDIISNSIKDGMKHFKRDEDPSYREFWSKTQQKRKCCGVDGPKDWQIHGGFEDETVPKFCCENLSNSCINSVAFSIGCKEDFIAAAKGSLRFTGSFSIVILLSEIFGIIFACSLLWYVKGKGQGL